MIAADRTRNLFTASYRACILGGCDVQEGRLVEGARHFRLALNLAETHAGRRSAAATLVACSLATLHYEWDDLDALDQLLADRLTEIGTGSGRDELIQRYNQSIGFYRACADYTVDNDRGIAVGVQKIIALVHRVI